MSSVIRNRRAVVGAAIADVEAMQLTGGYVEYLRENSISFKTS